MEFIFVVISFLWETDLILFLTNLFLLCVPHMEESRNQFALWLLQKELGSRHTRAS